MEVHHPHHPWHKKKWSEYLLEFFMLFVAVTLGFFAENIREGIADKHKEEEALRIVVHDFKNDKEEIQRHRAMIKKRLENCDNLLNLLEMDYRDIDKLEFYKTVILHAENKDLVLNEKARNDAESKGYFTSIEKKDLPNTLTKFNFYYNDYKIISVAVMEACKHYYSVIIPNLLDSKLTVKSEFIWTNEGEIDKNFQGKLKKPIDEKLAEQIRFDIWTRKTLLNSQLRIFDSLDQYSNKAVSIIQSEIKE
jgi:hypothetical protein